MHATRVILGHILLSFAGRSKPSTYVSNLPPGVVLTESTGSSPVEVAASVFPSHPTGIHVTCAPEAVGACWFGSAPPLDIPIVYAACHAPTAAAASADVSRRQRSARVPFSGLVGLLCWLCERFCWFPQSFV